MIIMPSNQPLDIISLRMCHREWGGGWLPADPRLSVAGGERRLSYCASGGLFVLHSQYQGLEIDSPGLAFVHLPL